MIESVTGPMGTYEEDAPRLSEIGRMIQGMDRKIDDFRGEVRSQLNDKVSKEVYQAQQAAVNDRILSVSNEANTRITALEAGRRSLTNTVYGGLASIIVGVILFYLQTKG